MGYQVKSKRLDARFLRSNGTPSFSSRIYERPGEVEVIAKRPVVTVTPTARIIDSLKIMASRGFRRLPIVHPGGRLLGIVTAMDFMDFLGGGKKYDLIVHKHGYKLYDALNEAVEKIMTRDVVKAYVDETLIDVLTKMVKYNVGAIPVVTSDDRIFGIITEKDIIDHLAEKITGKTVGEVMTSDVVTASSKTTLEEALRIMVSNGFRRLPIVDDGKLKGILVAMDVIRFLGQGRAFSYVKSDDIRDILSVNVSELMTRDLVTISPDRDIGEAASLMRKSNRGSLLVMENGRLAGIITERDLLIAVALE